MSQNFDNDNRGAIWRNEKKIKDTQPDFTGSIMVDGKDYFISGWKRKQGASPKSPAVSIAVTLKDQQSAPKPVSSPGVGEDDLDDIPF